MKALFIITSPLQILCAAEAYHCYQVSNADLIIKYGDNSLSNQLIDNTLSRYSFWGTTYSISKKRSLRDLIKVLRKLSNNHYDAVFNAEFNGWFQNVLLANVKFNKRIIYDDGTMTINDYHTYLAPRQPSFKKHFEKELILRLMGYRKFRLGVFDRIELFTMFDLQSLPHVTVVNNNFVETAFCRQNLSIDKKAPIVILGQPLIENGFVSAKHYLKCVTQLTQKKRCYYFAHRGEAESNLNKLKKLAAIKIICEDQPIEIAIEKYTISEVIGFTSTALKTLALLYPALKVSFIRISDEQLLGDKLILKSKFTALYNQFISEGLSEFDFRASKKPTF